MKPDIAQNVAQKVIDQWGEECDLNDVVGKVKVIIEEGSVALDNKDMMFDNEIILGFMKPLPKDPMKGTVVTFPNGAVVVIGRSVETNGYIVSYEATPQ